jgi:hypothetical protein
MKTNKTLLWVGIGSALLIGGGLFWWFKNKSKTDETNDTTKEPVKEEEKSKKEEAVIKTETSSTAPSSPSTPFNNKTEGDAFRAWMSVNHSDFRYKGDVLDKSGDYNNSFMKVAYDKYGKEYASKNVKKDTTNSAAVNSLMFLKGVDDTTIYSYPEFKGEYLLGSIAKSWLLDRAFGKFISDTGTGWIKFETIAFAPKLVCPPNARCAATKPEAKRVTAYIKKEFVSNKPY